MKLKKLKDRQLFQLYGDIIDELRRRKILRSSNNPVADYAEYLVSKKYKLQLTPNSNKGFDAVDQKTGKRYQIKSRRITQFSNSRQLSVIRSLNFDFLIAVVFRENFEIFEAYKIPCRLIKSPYAKFSKLQNGYILRLRGAILDHKDVRKINL